MKLLITFLCLFLWVSTASAVTRYVHSICPNNTAAYNPLGNGGAGSCTGGGSTPSYSTIANALAASYGSGTVDAVYIRAGTYNETLNDQVGVLWPSGTSWATPFIFAAYPGETVTIRPVSSSNGRGPMQIGQNPSEGLTQYIVVDRIIADGSGVTWTDPTNPTFGRSGDGISFKYTAHIRVQNSIVRGTGNNCIDSHYAPDDIQIIDTLLENCGDTGGDHGLYTTGGTAALPWIVRNVEIRNVSGYCIQHYEQGAGQGYHIVVERMNCHDSGAGIVTTGTLTMFNSFIYRVDRALQQASLGTVPWFIYNNLFWGVSKGGQSAFQVQNGLKTFRNNIINQLGTGSPLVERFPATSPTFASSNNIFFNTGSTTDLNGTTVNPRLANPANADFRPCTDVNVPHASCVGASPAILAGMNLSSLGISGLLTDAVGAARPAPPTLWTIGPLQGGAPPAGPTVSIISPTTATSYSSTSSVLSLSGISSSGVAIANNTWTCPTCSPTSGTATGTTSWTIEGITLATESNVITVVVTDNNGQTAVDVLTVNYVAAGLMAAYAFDESSGSSILDASGNSNTGTIGIGVSRGGGVSGGSLFFDGTANGVATVPDSGFLDLTGAMTISMYVSPTELATTWRALVTKYPGHWLYATAGDGVCPNSNKVYGGFEDSSSTSYVSVCSSAVLPVNQWTFVTFRWDGATEEIYFGTTLVGSRSAAGVITANASDLLIGNSPYLEGFKGFIDRIRIYNYAVPLTAGANACSDVPSITRDMNCRIGTDTITIKLNVTTRKTGPTITRKYGPPL